MHGISYRNSSAQMGAVRLVLLFVAVVLVSVGPSVTNGAELNRLNMNQNKSSQQYSGSLATGNTNQQPATFSKQQLHQQVSFELIHRHRHTHTFLERNGCVVSWQQKLKVESFCKLDNSSQDGKRANATAKKPAF